MLCHHHWKLLWPVVGTWWPSFLFPPSGWLLVPKLMNGTGWMLPLRLLSCTIFGSFMDALADWSGQRCFKINVCEKPSSCFQWVVAMLCLEHVAYWGMVLGEQCMQCETYMAMGTKKHVMCHPEGKPAQHACMRYVFNLLDSLWMVHVAWHVARFFMQAIAAIHSMHPIHTYF